MWECFVVIDVGFVISWFSHVAIKVFGRALRGTCRGNGQIISCCRDAHLVFTIFITK